MCGSQYWVRSGLCSHLGVACCGSKETVVFVLAAGDGLLVEQVALVRELGEAGIKLGPSFCTSQTHLLTNYLDLV